MSVGRVTLRRVQPILVNEFSIPRRSSEPMVRPTYGGWLVLDDEQRCLTVLDENLRRAREVAVPALKGRVTAAMSPDGSEFAFAVFDDLVVTDQHGEVRQWWHHPYAAPNWIRRPAVVFDGRGLLWLYTPANADGELAVFHVAEGKELSRAPLDSAHGLGLFLSHPDGHHVGLAVSMGQEGTISAWCTFDQGAIKVRTVPGDFLESVSADGERYVTTPHTSLTVVVRRFGDDELVDEGSSIGGFDWTRGDEFYYLTEAMFVTSDVLIVGVGFEEFVSERHLLVAADDLSLIRVIDYDVQGWRFLVSAPQPGRWVTIDRAEDWSEDSSERILRLWELPSDVR